MPDLIEAVNELALSFREIAARSDLSDAVRQVWTRRADTVEAAGVELRRLIAWSKPVSAHYGDISDLPPELVAQLSGVRTDELEDQIYMIVKAAGDEVELDGLLIQLFRRHGHVFERRFVTNKCYRMVQKGVIYSVPGRKGVYSIHPQVVAPPEEEEDLIGDIGFRRTPKPVPSPPADLTDLDDEIPF